MKLGTILGFKGDAAVRWFTRGAAGHVAVAIGNDQVVTSLTKTGVGIYPLSMQGTQVWAREPVGNFDLDKAMAWFKTVNGEKYGWDDIEKVSGLPVAQSDDNTMDCSDTSAHFLEAGGCPQFDPTFDKSCIAPADFEKSIASVKIT